MEVFLEFFKDLKLTQNDFIYLKCFEGLMKI